MLCDYIVRSKHTFGPAHIEHRGRRLYESTSTKINQQQQIKIISDCDHRPTRTYLTMMMIKATPLYVSLVLLVLPMVRGYYKHNHMERALSIFDPEFQASNEELYGISPDEYMQYIIPQQFIVGFDETIVSDTSDTTNVKQYIHTILETGGFANATALWFYQTTTFVGATIAGVDDALYNALKLDSTVVFIEPVGGSALHSSIVNIQFPFLITLAFENTLSGLARDTRFDHARKLAIASTKLGIRSYRSIVSL